MIANPTHSGSPLPLHGQLLLADPSLRGGIFRRSVIFLAEHNSKHGSSGLILNHPSGKTVGDLLPHKDFAPLRSLFVHDGGPVASDQLTFSAFWWNNKCGLRHSFRISAEEACVHIKKPTHLVRAFIGYSGWSAGQLENEFLSSSWIATTPQRNLLHHSHDLGLWSLLLREISPLHHILSEAPDDPALN